jgi:SAM-dependent methyltransferase
MSEPGGSPAQEWSAESYARNARFVSELGEPVVDWLDPKPNERVLDVGCGDGALTASIVARGAEVVGADIDGEARWPWYFPTPAEFAERPETHRFVVQRMELIPRPTPLPTGMRGWLETFANPFLAGVHDEERNTMLEEVTSLLAPSLRGRAGSWTADYVRLRFAAQLER